MCPWPLDWRVALVAANAAPRCTAHSKRTKQRCKSAAVRGWTVCRHHGAGAGAPKGSRGAMDVGPAERGTEASRARKRVDDKHAGALIKDMLAVMGDD